LFSEFPFKACFDKGTMKTKITREAGLLWLCRILQEGSRSAIRRRAIPNNPKGS